ncbi:transcriptional antiterminator, Rof [Ectothiorhodospiraceae bacterium WFHF3C12]|nr:transcriptional antiterminator, Rof [Ectothiorhodospiraceae bacterium WFHF3C12]
MTDYRPIPCETYAELEVSILHQLRLRIAWRDPGGERHLETLTPKDLNTRNHEEFLRAEDGRGRSLEIRLDRITRFEPLTPTRHSA